ncbi:MFS transporter [Enterobacter ludwigii]|uniref:MFS transporter n=1 Tax=Enterobacter ludwigii TaxID=299767 RepID=UPI00234C948E|nr:MFS transporter [Enterobacter ludwigii]MDC7315943.1 MFS transporter [Enterobacter ludwigii]MDI0404733.1 MFS transporter [Enterobacter ludwigii]MDI0413122.1 MFS transporter [Enterobacter ludwigii]MDI0415255.1 MFS transporter [Enterobacter ludwigii]MDI0430267.1 MFS transporter [Enterobacter ludwigii]
MNSLLYALIEALRCHRWLRLLACAFIFTSLGNGVTQVVVFGLLLAWSAPPALLTLAFLFATLPGFVGSLISEKLCARYSPISLLILTEGLGLLALLFPLLGVQYHSIPALLAVQSTEALLNGMSWPALTLLFKRGLREAELPAATCLENVFFAAQVLLGTGLGMVLFQKIAILALLAIDAISFLGSLFMLWLAGRVFLAPTLAVPTEEKAPAALRWQMLTIRQKRSLLILPALAAVGSPAMALLPAMAQQIHPQDAASLALPLLFARSMGQLCGPLLLKRDSLTRFAAHTPRILLCLGIFLAAYGMLPLLSGWMACALGMIFVAHLASNVLFAAGTFAVLSSFQTTHMASASSKAWRWQTLSASLFTGIAAMAAAGFGSVQALYSVSSAALILVALIMYVYRE